MSAFWLKMAGFAVVIAAIVIAVSFLSSPEAEEEIPVVFEQEARQVETPEAEEVEVVRQEATEQPERRKRPTRPSRPRVVREQIEIVEGEEVNPQAEKLYQMAVIESKIARKPMMTYKKMVDYCRQLIQDYPDTKYAKRARQLLRQMPERERRKYNVTNEEMGSE